MGIDAKHKLHEETDSVVVQEAVQENKTKIKAENPSKTLKNEIVEDVKSARVDKKDNDYIQEAVQQMLPTIDSKLRKETAIAETEIKLDEKTNEIEHDTKIAIIDSKPKETSPQESAIETKPDVIDEKIVESIPVQEILQDTKPEKINEKPTDTTPV